MSESVMAYAVIGGRVAVPLTKDNYLALNMFSDAIPITYGGRDFRYSLDTSPFGALVEVLPACAIDTRTPAQRELEEEVMLSNPGAIGAEEVAEADEEAAREAELQDDARRAQENPALEPEELF